MKKILMLLITIIPTINVFSQTCGSALCEFSQPAAYLSITLPINDKSRNYLELNTYLFWANGKFYTISYDTCSNVHGYYHYGDRFERNVYLFRLDDSVWHIASNIIKVDYDNVDANGIRSFDYYFPSKHDITDAIGSKNIKEGVNKGYVKKLSNGNIEMRLLYFHCNDQNKRDLESYYYYWEVITFIPTNNEFYIIKK